MDRSKISHFNTIVCDVDNTICTTPEGVAYENSIPHLKMIEKLNTAYVGGFKIIYYTARGQRSQNGDMEKIFTNRILTLTAWLKKHHVKYDELIWGKPYGCIYIDDRTVKPRDFLNTSLKSLEVMLGCETDMLADMEGVPRSG